MCLWVPMKWHWSASEPIKFQSRAPLCHLIWNRLIEASVPPNKAQWVNYSYNQLPILSVYTGRPNIVSLLARWANNCWNAKGQLRCFAYYPFVSEINSENSNSGTDMWPCFLVNHKLPWRIIFWHNTQTMIPPSFQVGKVWIQSGLLLPRLVLGMLWRGDLPVGVFSSLPVYLRQNVHKPMTFTSTRLLLPYLSQG